MNEAEQSLNEISRPDNKLELGVKFIEIIRRAVLSDFAQTTCKPLQFASQLQEIPESDPYMSGDHAETMTALLERNLLTVDDEEEPSKLESVSEMTALKSEAFSTDGGESSSELLEDTVKTVDIRPQRLLTEDDAWRAIKPCTDLSRKTCELLRLFGQDLLVADLKISLYITACNNLRIKPFPEHIVDETANGLVGLAMINNLIPPVHVLKHLLERRTRQLNAHVVNVVHWLMVQLRQPKLIVLPEEEFDSVFERVEHGVNVQHPAHVVKIMVNNLSSNYLQWQAVKGQQSTRFAFYGSKVDHVHSLVHLGLYPFQKVSGPLGKGIYLTTDLKACLDSSPPSWVWGKSVIGTQLQTVAVVEFVDSNRSVVRYWDPNFVPRPGQAKPFNYYVPHTNLIQARYLLIFVRDAHRSHADVVKSDRGTFNKVLIGGAFVGSYLTLCYIAWKSIKNPNVTLWDALTDKIENLRVLKHLLRCMRQSSP